MTDIKEHSIDLCKELDVLYWEHAFMGPRMRGSKVRVTPHRDMMRMDGYLKQVVVMGELRTLLFDALYLKHYKAVTGIDYVLQWTYEPASETGKLFAIDSSQLILDKLAEFLKSANIALSDKNPRHSLLVKFKKHIEAQDDDRS